MQIIKLANGTEFYVRRIDGGRDGLWQTLEIFLDQGVTYDEARKAFFDREALETLVVQDEEGAFQSTQRGFTKVMEITWRRGGLSVKLRQDDDMEEAVKGLRKEHDALRADMESARTRITAVDETVKASGESASNLINALTQSVQNDAIDVHLALAELGGMVYAMKNERGANGENIRESD